MNKLQAVNRVLIALGETPVSSLEVQYPTLNQVLPLFDEAIFEVLEDGWWFNTQYDITIQADVNGELVVPAETIKFIPDDRDYVFDGARVVHAGTGTALTDQDITGRLVTLREFEDLPRVARYAVTFHCAAQAYISDHGEDSTSRNLEQSRDRHLIRMGGDHTRNRKVNSRRDSRSVQRWYRSLRA